MELEKTIEETYNRVVSERCEASKKIEESFKEAHEKLKEKTAKKIKELERAANKSGRTMSMEEHDRVLKKMKAKEAEILEGAEKEKEALRAEENKALETLKAVCSKCEEELQASIHALENAREWVGSKADEISRAVMADLEVEWDEDERKLAFTRYIFNGEPALWGVSFPSVFIGGADVSWECDLSRMLDADRKKVGYAVEVRRRSEDDDEMCWRAVYAGPERRCSARGLEAGTEYSVRVRCVVGDLLGRWSAPASVRTKDFLPPNGVRVSGIAWDAVALAWDPVPEAESYEVEVDGKKDLCATPFPAYTQRELIADTEHAFRVRARAGDAVSEWCWGAVRTRTPMTSRYTGAWKACPPGIFPTKVYSVSPANPRVATVVGGEWNDWCNIIGNTPLPLGAVTSWGVKVLRSENGRARFINVGVAPADIDQEGVGNYEKCGWYFDCFFFTKQAGPPHNYEFPGKAYGPHRDHKVTYVRPGDSVGVVMDTTKGELSFIVCGKNYGVAFDGIPLDKPLVPCVIMQRKGNSVELVC